MEAKKPLEEIASAMVDQCQSIMFAMVMLRIVKRTEILYFVNKLLKQFALFEKKLRTSVDNVQLGRKKNRENAAYFAQPPPTNRRHRHPHGHFVYYSIIQHKHK